MMKRKSQFLALLMTLCLLAGLVAVPVQAANVTDADITRLEKELADAKKTLAEKQEAKKTAEEEADIAGKTTEWETAKTNANIGEKEKLLEDATKLLEAAKSEVERVGEDNASEEQKNAVTDAQKQVTEAQEALNKANQDINSKKEALDTAQGTVAEAEKAVEEAEKAVNAADKALRDARAQKEQEEENQKPTATAKVDISISSSSVDFGSLTIGATSGLTKSFTITNNSDFATKIGVSGSLTNASYSLDKSDLTAKGSSCTVTVTVVSTAKAGSIGGTLTVSAAINDAQAGSDSKTSSVSVSGKIASDSYSITASPSTKDFGKLTEGYEEKVAKEKEITVTITNKSDKTVRLTDVKGNDHFTVTADKSGTVELEYNKEATYKVVPKQNLSAGSYTDTITFQTREGATATLKATVVVEKKEAALTLTPSTVTFGTVQQGYAAINYQTVTVKNNTEYPMTLEQPGSYNFEIGLLSKTALPAGGTATFTIRPMTGLMSNIYDGRITVRASGYSADLAVSFTVTPNMLLLTSFLDVPADYSFAADIAYVTQKGLMNGTGDGKFSPWGTTNRGQIVTILHRLAGSPVVAGAGFTDVAAGSYCENAVKWAAASGITNGYEDGSFKPGAPITRQQLAAFLFRYAANRNLASAARADLSKFSDAETVSAPFRDALAWANAVGLVNGTGEGTLNPTGGATRAQAAAILHRFCENVAK